MPDDNNLLVPVDGDQAVIGTDVYSSGGETAHAQVMKVAWGDQNTVNRANTNSPLPVKVYGMSGPFDTITVTGAVRGLGTFTIGNTSGSPVHVTGGVNSFVYGVVGATPVAVTGAVNISSPVSVTGPVTVTGGRFLNFSTDTVSVIGTVSRQWYLSNLVDNVTVYGFGGATFLSSKIMGSDGTVIGNSGGALNVNVIGAGISATVSIDAVVGVQNATGGVLRIEGTANGTPVPVSISALPIVQLNAEGENSSTNPIYIDSLTSEVTYSNLSPNTPNYNNLEKLLISKAGTNNHTVATWVQYLWNSLGENNATAGGTIQGKLTNLINSFSGTTGNASVKTRLSLSQSGSTIKKFTLVQNVSPRTIFPTDSNFIPDATNGYLYINNTGHNVILTSDAFLTQEFGNPCVFVNNDCPSGVSVNSGTGEITVTGSQNVLNGGGYLLENDQEIFLPIKFTRFFLSADTDVIADGPFTVIVS